MKPWFKNNSAAILRGIKTGFLLGIVLGLGLFGAVAAQQACATVREYDPATATLKDTTKSIPAWAVGQHYEEMLKAFKEGKKIKVVYIKKENPIAAWTLGAGMVIGGLLIIVGIAIIAFSQGARLWRGLMFVGTGIGSFITFYMIDKYLVWICVAFTVALIGGLVYFYFFAKETTDKAIETNDLQKGGEWTDEVAEEARKLQGGLQDVISRRAKSVRQRREKKKVKGEKIASA